jgi:sulfatase maturation enzyme AslB (radical SAM superfamily)
MPLTIPETFPDVIRIESVGICNFKSIHCPTGTEPNLCKALSPEHFQSILQQFKDHNFIPRVVVLDHGGEPLLNKNLGSFIRELKDFGVNKTVITTNASLLTEAKAEELILAGLDEMKVSFDGGSPEENNAIRVKGDFFKHAANIKAMCKIRKKLGRTNPTIIISNIQIPTRETLVEMGKSGVLDCQTQFKQIPSYLTDYFKDELEELTFGSFPAHRWPGYEKFGKFGEISLPLQEPTQYCGSLFETYSILSNENVVPCCNDLPGELVQGNIFNYTAFEVWNSDNYRELRDNFKAGFYHPVFEKCVVVNPRFFVKKRKLNKRLC